MHILKEALPRAKAKPYDADIHLHNLRAPTWSLCMFQCFGV